MRLDLILKDVQDPWARENFNRLIKFVTSQTILQGEWKFFEIELREAGTNIPFKHNLSFVPKDVIQLSVDGDYNYFFNHKKFDSENIYITTEGPVRLRFLAGSYKEKGVGLTTNPFATNPPAGIDAGLQLSRVIGVLDIEGDSHFDIEANNGFEITGNYGANSGLDVVGGINIDLGGEMTINGNSSATVGG